MKKFPLMKHDLFISYSRRNFDEVNSFIELLKSRIPALDIWFDIDGIESGDEFEDKIISAIDNSAYILFALSDAALESQWTKDEVMYAKNTDKKVIPLLLKGATMKGWFLFKFGRVDCIDITNELQVDKLVNNLSSWTGKQKCSDTIKTVPVSTIQPTSTETLDSRELCRKGDDFYYGENGVSKDYAEAVKWYKKSAELGYAYAQYSLGYCYECGKGVSVDYAEAVKWYRKAAELGDAVAQDGLGYCYECGQGVSQDYAEAVKWYRKAAEQGHASAQWSLGLCYKKGLGVTADYAEAVKWYKKAAEQGNAGAQWSLGLCYKKGEGVEKNIDEAIKWFSKCAEQGDAGAKNQLKELRGY